MTHSEQYLAETVQIAQDPSLPAQIESLVSELKALRDRGGRLFLVGLGGSAANCSHAVNDFRRLCGIDAWGLENMALLTATINDDGWNHIFDHLKGDLFVLSVGGGTNQVSTPICRAVEKAKANGCRVFGIVGRDGGLTKELGDVVVVIPSVEPSRVTPHTEAFQMVILHCLVSHPDLQIRSTKW